MTSLRSIINSFYFRISNKALFSKAIHTWVTDKFTFLSLQGIIRTIFAREVNGENVATVITLVVHLVMLTS